MQEKKMFHYQMLLLLILFVL